LTTNSLISGINNYIEEELIVKDKIIKRNEVLKQKTLPQSNNSIREN